MELLLSRIRNGWRLMPTMFSRRSITCVSLLVLIAGGVLIFCLKGCSEQSIPLPIVPVSELPFELKWTVNEIEAGDLNTVIEVLPEKPLLLFGTLHAKPGEAFARSEDKHSPMFVGLTPKPLPDPMLTYVPSPFRKPPSIPPDKPEHLHADLLALAVPFGTQQWSVNPAGLGPTGHYVDPNRKLLTFSGGLLSPARPGKYTLCLWTAYKYEREFRKHDVRSQLGKYKPIREITLIVTKPSS